MFEITGFGSYRGSGLEPLFPLWQISTGQLSRDMIAAGVKAKMTCVDPSKIAESFAGCECDLSLLNALPAGADPCGENGEFSHVRIRCPGVFSPY
jgi:diphthamide synthase (EF-2-diphthine--ammonia ligase)